MTREDVIRIAREAGFVTDEADFIYPPKTIRRGIGLEIERVIVLAAAAEREACARIADKCIEDSQKVIPESEQEENYMVAMRILSEEFAIAIRARGEE